MRLHHLALRSRHPEQLARFYQDILALPVVKPWSGYSLWLGLEGAVLMVEQAAEGEPGVPPGSLELSAWSVDARGRDAVRQRLAERAIPVEHETDHTTYFRDPDGRRVAVSTWPFEALS